MFDGYGYPEEITLERIREWPQEDFEGVLELLQSAWIYDEYITRTEDGSWWVSTGGWSGHEELLGALRENQLWWMFHWKASRSGGHYIFSPVRWDYSVNFNVEAND